MIPAKEAVTDPVGTIVALVAAVGPATETTALRRVVEQVSGGRAKRRRLAAELAADPSVLSTGLSPASKAAGDLLLALRTAGAAGVSAPRCAECGREIGSMQRRGDHWYCSPCFTRTESCAGCGKARKATFRDRHGRPRCSECPDRDPRDPRDLLAAIITSADPSLDAVTVNAVLGQVVAKAAHLQKLAWAGPGGVARPAHRRRRQGGLPDDPAADRRALRGGSHPDPAARLPDLRARGHLEQEGKRAAGLPRLRRPLPRRPVRPLRTSLRARIPGSRRTAGMRVLPDQRPSQP